MKNLKATDSLRENKPSSVDEKEVAQFSAIAAEWWDVNGKFKPLHQLNPVRLGYIRDQICAHFDRDPTAPLPLKGLTILDVGCGGGLVTEPLCRMGATVTGLDASQENIKIAAEHALKSNLDITYLATTAEDLANDKKQFDVVIALEIVEHVANLDIFMEACCAMIKDKGMTILSTLNRTPKSFLLGIVAAEYILRWLPRGTHDWHKFLRPSELVRHLRQNTCQTTDLTGLIYSPISQKFSLNKDDLDVNYMLTAVLA